MKKYVMAFLAAAMFCAVLLLSGCASRDENLVGTWVREINPAFSTTFEADGNASHAMTWGFGTEFTWSTTRGRIIWNYPGHDRMHTDYTIDGDVLTIYLDGGISLRYRRQ